MGVRELREHTGEVPRLVREENAEYVVTHQGKPITVIMPVVSEAVEGAMVEAAEPTLWAGGRLTSASSAGSRSNPPQLPQRSQVRGPLR
jgi:antitoxin (DNA-binding transcriptional repressor) of toxin-antitoxin stability system